MRTSTLATILCLITVGMPVYADDDTDAATAAGNLNSQVQNMQPWSNTHGSGDPSVYGAGSGVYPQSTYTPPPAPPSPPPTNFNYTGMGRIPGR